jgi:hypothetical protein
MNIATPAVVARTADGKILAVEPLKAVPFFARGCTQWNFRIAQRRKG